MVSYKDIYDKLKEFEQQRERIYDAMQRGGFNRDPQLALTLIKEAGQLYEDIKGRDSAKEATKIDTKRFDLVCKMLNEFSGVKASARKGIDDLLG